MAVINRYKKLELAQIRSFSVAAFARKLHHCG
jgi:hypothetical protein